MCPTQVRIYFDSPSVTYSPGETITGKVLLHLRREKQILGIDMNLIGKTKVNYMKSERQTMPRHHGRKLSTYRDKYFVVKDCKLLHREINGELSMNEQRLPAGTYEYPFAWILPENIPSSFEGPYGWVRYRMEVVVRHSFWDHRCEAESEFHVLGHYDLNTLGRVMREVQVENKYINVFNQYGSIYLELTLELERRAYAAGETIRFATTSDLRCLGGHPPLQGVKVALVQEQTYKIKDKIRRHSAKIQEIHGPMTFCNEIEVWNGSMEMIPLPPTNLGGECRFIEIQYFLRAKLSVNETDRIDINIKLQIGTVPLRRHSRQRVSTPEPEATEDFSMSFELPTAANSTETLTNGVNGGNSRGQSPQNSTWAPSEGANLLAVPGQSRRASAPPSWLEVAAEEISTEPVAGPSAPFATFDFDELETPPPSYTDAVFLGSAGFLDVPRDQRQNYNDDPPAYPRQPPFFLRKGAKHLHDSNDGYATL